MSKCISIYPHPVDETYIRQVKEYISESRSYGFDEVFTSIHLPEYPFSMQLEAFEVIAQSCLEEKMELTADIGGKYIDLILNDEEILGRMKKIPFSYLRLDYGFEIGQVRKLYETLNIRGFVINASMYDEEKADELIGQLKQIDPNIILKACHNFYVRPETGLDEAFALSQSRIFEKYNIPVYYCIPSYSNPRGPLYEGLCTIEKHRHQPIREILTDLCINDHVKAFLMADEWLSSEELEEVSHTLQILKEAMDQVAEIPVAFYENISEQEKEAILKKHRFRYDSSSEILRSQTSRQMAEYAKAYPPNNTIERKAGAITIDNSSYKRYSGEVQVVLSDLKEDERVNVAARIIDPDDLIRLARFREGHEYQFKEGE